MNRIASRAWIVILLAALLIGGLLFFLGDFLINSHKWVVFSGSPHLYEGKDLQQGTVVDRDGQVLLDFGEDRTYAEDSKVRKAMLHWVGDRYGNIQPPLVSEYTLDLWGYEPINGLYNYGDPKGTLELTLSSELQITAMEALGNRKGVVAVMNYRTGEVLCAVSAPSYDPENVPDIAADTSGSYEGVYVNRFTQSGYIPGSIFKIVTTAAALECVPGAMERTYTCSGVTEMEGSKVICTGVHGTQTLQQAFANSCNCAYAQIAELVGRKNMNHYVQQFGVAQSVEFDGITTRAGYFDMESTDRLSLCWSAIGQHQDLINPCGYLCFVSAVAAGGSGVKPYVVERVSVNGDTTYRASTVGMTRVMSRSAADTLKDLMRNNVIVKYGADHFPGLAVCAKSGTAETGNGKSNALFTGFVDSDRYPLAFIVIVEEGGYGSSTCVPIASKVLSACVEVMDGQ